MPAKHIPEGFHTVTPYLTCTPVGQVIDFLKKTFDATEIERMSGPDGRLMHAELKVGDSIVMLGEPSADWKPMPAALYLYVPDCDASYKRALAAGGESILRASPTSSMAIATSRSARPRRKSVVDRDPSGRRRSRRDEAATGGDGKEVGTRPLCWPRAAAEPPVANAGSRRSLRRQPPTPLFSPESAFTHNLPWIRYRYVCSAAALLLRRRRKTASELPPYRCVL